MSAEGIPNAMQWQIKRLKVLQKETVTMTPNKTTDVRPGQTIIVDLPYNSKVDLSSFSWFYDGSTTHNGSSGVNGPAGYVQSRFFPRNSASVIQKFTVKVNGGIKVDIPDYNFVYNMLHDYTQGADALKRRQTGGENSDPSNKLYITDGDIQERRGYSLAPYAIGLDPLGNIAARDKGRYCVRSWLSLFGGNASTQVVDTQMLGTVTVEIQLAPASILMFHTATSLCVSAAQEFGGGVEAFVVPIDPAMISTKVDFLLASIWGRVGMVSLHNILKCGSTILFFFGRFNQI